MEFKQIKANKLKVGNIIADTLQESCTIFVVVKAEDGTMYLEELASSYGCTYDKDDSGYIPFYMSDAPWHLISK